MPADPASLFYILDWAFAYRQSERAEFLEQMRAMVGYWWPRRDGRNLLLIESRSPEEDERFYNINAPGQTLSLAASLLESAPLLEERESALGDVMRERARAYIDGFLAAPHDPEEGIFAILSRRDDNAVAQAMPIWGSVYGVWPASYVALTALCAHRLTGDARLLDWAVAVGGWYESQMGPSFLQHGLTRIALLAQDRDGCPLQADYTAR